MLNCVQLAGKLVTLEECSSVRSACRITEELSTFGLFALLPVV